MKQFGRRIYYDKSTGNIIFEISEQSYTFDTTQPTIEQDISTYTALSERNRDTFDVLQLEYGQYAQDFAECNGYRVNPETKQLEFSYPDDSSAPETQEPVYQKPLSEQVSELEASQALMQQALDDLILGGV